MRKLSFRHKYVFSKDKYIDLIKEMKDKVKKDPTIIEKFEEYGVPIDEVDHVHVEFSDLPVSAKTKNMKIYLNVAMLSPDSDIKDPTAYLIHEMVHFLQQKTGNTEGHNAVDEYLDKPTEVESFQAQVDYKKRNEGEEESKEYVEDLLDYHKYKGKKRKEKKKELMDE